MSERRLTDAELEASRWISRLEASDVTLEDHQRFRQWLAASEENRIAHEALSRTWDKLDALKLLAPEFPVTARPRRRTLSRRVLLAGGGAVVGAGALSFWALTPATTFAASYRTPVGGRETAELQDGSSVALNADTELRVAFTAERRRATLSRGEALFTVAEDPRGFEVRTPFGAVLAEAGVFSVKVGPDFVRTSVFAGRVSSREAADIVGVSQELVLSREAASVAPLSEERASQRLAWREHRLAFAGESLREAAADVSAQTGMRFVFANSELEALRVGGYIDARDGEAFLSLLENNLGVEVRRRADGSIILMRRSV